MLRAALAVLAVAAAVLAVRPAHAENLALELSNEALGYFISCVDQMRPLGADAMREASESRCIPGYVNALMFAQTQAPGGKGWKGKADADSATAYARAVAEYVIANEASAAHDRANREANEAAREAYRSMGRP